MVDNDYIQFTESNEEDGEYTIFTIEVTNYDVWNYETVEDIIYNPLLGNWLKIGYVSHTLTRGYYNYHTNTWTIPDLKSGETATLTITTIATEFPEVETPIPTTVDAILKRKFIDETVIIKKALDGSYYGVTRNMTAQIGGTVLIRSTDECGDITSGQSSDSTANNTEGTNNGSSECTVDLGDEIPIEIDDSKDTGDDDGDNITEPGADEDCIRGYTPALVKEAHGYTKGINGGNLWHVNFQKDGLDGIWIYPGIDQPFFLDVSLEKESATDNRDSVPDCWPEGGDHASFTLLHACQDPETGEHYHKFGCPDGECCLWPGDTDFTTLRNNVCSGWPDHYGQIWHPKPGDKYQFWYPFGALWIWIKKAGVDDYSGPGGDLTYPTGYTQIDGETPWTIINTPNFQLAPNMGDFEDDYDPSSGGGFGDRMSYDECMESLKVQVPDNEERDKICKEGTSSTNTDGWTDCMKRLFSRDNTLNEDQARNMCENHPNWTTCMIHTYYASGETMTEDELIEACKGQGDSYTLKFIVGLCDDGDCSPFLITDMAFWVSGSSGCLWGWPNIPLWWSSPNTGISKLRVCMPSEDDLNRWYGTKTVEEDRYPNTVDK